MNIDHRLDGIRELMQFDIGNPLCANCNKKKS